MDLKILDGRGSFYQWDLNQKLQVTNPAVEEVHFPTEEGNALVCLVYDGEDSRVVDVPNILLQTAGVLRAFAVAGERTLFSHIFRVNPREKPDDYIYTETEVLTVEKAVEKALQEAKESGELQENTISYSPQKLTEDQKAQARKNIGAEDWMDKTVEFDNGEVLADGLALDGYVYNGKPDSQTTHKRTDYLSISDFVKVAICITAITTTRTAVNMKIARYDKDKNFIADGSVSMYPLDEYGTVNSSGKAHANLTKINTEAAYAHGMGIELSASDYGDGTAYIMLFNIYSDTELTMSTTGYKEVVRYTIPEGMLPESVVGNTEKNGLLSVGYGLMTTDAGGSFTVSSASSWKMYAYPVQEGKEYDLTLVRSWSSASRVKWAFSSLPCDEITLDNLVDSIVSFAEPITKDNLTDPPSCETVTAPNGAKSIVLNSNVASSISSGNTNIIKYEDDAGNEKIVPSSAVKVDFSAFAKNAVSAGAVWVDGELSFPAGDYVLGTIVKTKANTENIILRMASRVVREETATKYPAVWGRFNNIFKSTEFCLNNEEYIENSWRFPAFGNINDAMAIILNVPAGNTLYIKDIRSEFSSVVYPHETGIRLTAHLGAYDLAPENTMYGFIAAHNLGYPRCIANPKLTADGVWVCIHDGDLARTATHADGSPVAEGAVLVAESTYADLLQYDVGQSKNIAYKGARIPKVEDFLRYCGIVGMKPSFSFHGNFTAEQYQSLKNMMARYGVLGSFNCKASSMGIFESAFAVFGDDINGYEYYTNDVDNIDTILADIDNSSLGSIKDRVIVEIKQSVLTEEIAQKVVAAGYRLGAYDIVGMKGERYKAFIEWGVTEFVDDRNCSYGLNW